LATVRTRFAPSPSGKLHFGVAKIALYCWLFAEHHGGQFILRIEDTDQARSTPQATQEIITALHWLGLYYHEGLYFQSKRAQNYQAVLEKLLKTGHAYCCSCSSERLQALRNAQMAQGVKPRYDGYCRYHPTSSAGNGLKVVRFKNPEAGIVTVEDRILGTVHFNNTELDDFILARSDGTPTYNFTVVVDDYELEITHVIRGNDHLNNTPRQINLFKALNAPIPVYMHLPMVHSDEGKKLSKREGATSIMEYRAMGFLPDAIINYLARLGWSHGDQEIFSREELIRYFDGQHLSKAPAIFNYDKLLWLNQYYLKNTHPARVAEAFAPFTQSWTPDPYPLPDLSDIVIAQRDRVKTLQEMAQKSQFFYEEPTGDLQPPPIEVLPGIKDLIIQLQQLEQWEKINIYAALKDVMDKHQLKPNQLFQTLRRLLAGATISPPVDTTIALLGKQRVLARLRKVIQ
jgi:glutamyl-tRNA synthetase